MKWDNITKITSKQFSLKESVTLYEATGRFILQYYFYLYQFLKLENEEIASGIEWVKDRRKLTDVSRTYLEWFETEGEPAFEFVSSHLMAGELNEKVIAFYRYYSFMLAEVLEQHNLELLLDQLYRIPSIMKEEYEKWGFLSHTVNALEAKMADLADDFVWKKNKGPQCKVPCFVW